MRFNFFSESGDGVGFCMRLQEEGHESRIWIRDHNAMDCGSNLVKHVGTPQDLIEDADKDGDVFIFDGSGNGLIADKIRDEGFAVLGGSLIADKLEEDRTFGIKVMKEAGIDTPFTKRFEDWEKAIAFVEGHDERLVYKPSGKLAVDAMASVPHDNDQLIEMLTKMKDEGIEDPEFELQEFKEGVAVSSECWFLGDRFAEGMFNHTLERKQLMNDDIGPSGGCTGNTVWKCGDCPICDTLRGTGGFLKEYHYIGPIDLNAIIAEDGIYGLEWTPRFGYDATPTLLWTLLNGELGKFFYDISHGNTLSKDILRDNLFGASIKISIPPWPTEKLSADKDIPIQGVKKNDEDVFLYNVKFDEEKKYLASAGAWGSILLFMGEGESVSRSFTKPLRRAKELGLSNKQYRTDLAQVFKEDLEQLEEVLNLSLTRR